MSHFNQNYHYPNTLGSCSTEELKSLELVELTQESQVEALQVAEAMNRKCGLFVPEDQIPLLARLLSFFGESSSNDTATRHVLAVRECLLLSGESTEKIDRVVAETARENYTERVHAFLQAIEDDQLPAVAKLSAEAKAVFVMGEFARCFSDTVFFPRHRAYLLSALSELATRNYPAALQSLSNAQDTRSRQIDQGLERVVAFTESFVSTCMRDTIAQIAQWHVNSGNWEHLEECLRKMLL